MRAALVLALGVVVTGCPETPVPVVSDFHAAEFPAGFAWGTATAGWQLEGDEGVNGAVDSNWSRWMAMGKGKNGQTNPRGNGFATLYAEDAARAAELGLETFRVSIDWSRVEPEPGVFDEAELDHIDDVLQALVDNNLKPVVTLWHWTVPTWVQNPDPASPLDRIASKDRSVVDDFEEFVRVVVPRIKDKVDTYTVLNEPLSMMVVGYIDGKFPPGQVFNIPKATDLGINLMYMQARAFDVIKELDENSFVGLTMTANIIYPERPDSAQETLAADSLNYVYNDWFIRALTTGELDVDFDTVVDPLAGTDPVESTDPSLAGRIEFIGVQYYGPVRVKESAFLSSVPPLYGLPLVNVTDYTAPEDRLLPHNGMDREISVIGFKDTLDRYATWGLPLIVTENGTTTNAIDGSVNEDQAAMYLVTHLWELGLAMEKGADVRGYFHWTLADNYEWVEGTEQHFGAYSVDFATFERTKTKMGQALQDVVAEGVSEAVWNRYVLERFPTDTTDEGRGFTTSEEP